MNKFKKPSAPSIHPGLESVALVTARAAADAGGMSMSWWYAEVASGRAPKPAFISPRCTRWRLVDVRDFWQAFGGQTDEATDAAKARAIKASAAALAKRRGAAAAKAQHNAQA